MNFKMDKKNIVIGVTCAAFGLLLRKHLKLISDFKHDFGLLVEIRKADEEQVEMAREIIFDKIFEDIVDHYDQ